MIGGMVRLVVAAVGAAVVTKAGERAAAHVRTQAELYAMNVAAKKARRRWEASPLGKAAGAFKNVFTGEKAPTVIDVEPLTTEGERKMFDPETREKLWDATGAATVAAKAIFRDVKENAGPALTKAKEMAQDKGATVFAAAKGKFSELRGKIKKENGNE